MNSRRFGRLFLHNVQTRRPCLSTRCNRVPARGRPHFRQRLDNVERSTSPDVVVIHFSMLILTPVDCSHRRPACLAVSYGPRILPGVPSMRSVRRHPSVRSVRRQPSMSTVRPGARAGGRAGWSLSIYEANFVQLPSSKRSDQPDHEAATDRQ